MKISIKQLKQKGINDPQTLVMYQTGKWEDYDWGSKEIISNNIDFIHLIRQLVEVFKIPNMAITWDKWNGDWIKYTYNEQGLLEKTEDAAGAWEKHEYNEKGEVFHQSSSGFWCKYTYNKKGLVIKYENSEDHVITHKYNKQGLLILRNDDGKWYEYEYDDKGLLIKIKDYQSGETKYTYQY